MICECLKCKKPFEVDKQKKPPEVCVDCYFESLRSPLARAKKAGLGTKIIPSGVNVFMASTRG